MQWREGVLQWQAARGGDPFTNFSMREVGWQYRTPSLAGNRSSVVAEFAKLFLLILD
jgi:hypothetical protein